MAIRNIIKDGVINELRAGGYSVLDRYSFFPTFFKRSTYFNPKIPFVKQERFYFVLALPHSSGIKYSDRLTPLHEKISVFNFFIDGVHLVLLPVLKVGNSPLVFSGSNFFVKLPFRLLFFTYEFLF